MPSVTTYPDTSPTAVEIQRMAKGGKLFHYEQDADPGAVGAGKWWAQTSTKILYRRNAGNTGWDSWSGIFGP